MRCGRAYRAIPSLSESRAGRLDVLGFALIDLFIALFILQLPFFRGESRSLTSLEMSK
jgi:hypothetical protein